jgi:hypothetical protein
MTRHSLLSTVTLALVSLISGLHGAMATSRVVTGDRPGLGGTTHAMAADGSLATYFRSSYDNWQYIQIDFGCVGQFSAIRRYMSRDGTDTVGHRVLQGEGFSYSLDAVNWTPLTGSTTHGWGAYVNYVPHAWHSVNYGWSAALKLNAPALARYVRFNWDGNSDAVHEIQVDFSPRSGSYCTQFEDLPLGQRYRIRDAFAASGTGLTVKVFQWTNGQWTSNGYVKVVNGNRAGGSGQELYVNNANVLLEFCDPPAGLSLLLSHGGNLNIEINGEFVNFRRFAEIDGRIIGGVAVSLASGPAAGQGELKLEGKIYSFTLGGQELWIDDLCVRR